MWQRIETWKSPYFSLKIPPSWGPNKYRLISSKPTTNSTSKSQTSRTIPEKTSCLSSSIGKNSFSFIFIFKFTKFVLDLIKKDLMKNWGIIAITASRFHDIIFVLEIHFGLHEIRSFFLLSVSIYFGQGEWIIFTLDKYFFLLSQKLKTRKVVDRVMVESVLWTGFLASTLERFRNSDHSLKVMLCDPIF